MQVTEVVEVYEKYRNYILQGCHLGLSSVYSLDDLWQDVIVDGIVNAQRLFDPSKGASFSTYISCRGRWFAKKWIHRRAREPTFIEVEDYHIISTDSSDEDDTFLKDVLSEMSLRERIIFRGICDGMSESEIATRLDISKQRVSQIVFQTRRRLLNVFPDYAVRAGWNRDNEDC